MEESFVLLPASSFELNSPSHTSLTTLTRFDKLTHCFYITPSAAPALMSEMLSPAPSATVATSQTFASPASCPFLCLMVWPICYTLTTPQGVSSLSQLSMQQNLSCLISPLRLTVEVVCADVNYIQAVAKFI